MCWFSCLISFSNLSLHGKRSARLCWVTGEGDKIKMNQKISNMVHFIDAETDRTIAQLRKVAEQTATVSYDQILNTDTSKVVAKSRRCVSQRSTRGKWKSPA